MKNGFERNSAKFIRRVSWLGILWMTSSSSAFAADSSWPQFRGPGGNGIAKEAAPPLAWSETSNVRWKVAIPGRGRSSPVVMNDRVWMTLAIEQGISRTRIGPDDMQTAEHVTLKAVCVDAKDGKLLWETQLFDVDHPAPVHWLNSWATPTPAVEAGRLYCDFGTFGTASLNAETGTLVWKRSVPVDHQVGPGSSPAVFGNLLILVRDGRDAQFLTALDKATGEPVWRTERPAIQTTSPNLKKSFCSPAIFDVNGKPQMVVPGAHWVVSYDPLTGGEIWRALHGKGFSIGASAVFGHGMVYFSTGCFKAELRAIRADGSGDVTETNAVWKSLKGIPVIPSPVLDGDEIYWVSDDGMATCADAKTGAVCWQERLGGTHMASPLLAQGRLYCFSQSGKATILKAGRELQRLGENAIEGSIFATPALVGRSIFLRTDTHLYRIEDK